MAEYKLFKGDVAHVSTAEFHKDRERAPHLEQKQHAPRLRTAAGFIIEIAYANTYTVSDLGCGDGGLLSLIQGVVTDCWGYDFAPANVEGWEERGVRGHSADVFGKDSAQVEFGDVTVVTEVLEHLTNPHNAVRWIGENSPWIVASSPWKENDQVHDECHAWAWDPEGYRNLFRTAGYTIDNHQIVDNFQIVRGYKGI